MLKCIDYIFDKYFVILNEQYSIVIVGSVTVFKSAGNNTINCLTQ